MTMRKRMLMRGAADAAIIATAAVMAFGQLEFLIHLVRFGSIDYEPFPMTYLFYPTGLAAFAVSLVGRRTRNGKSIAAGTGWTALAAAVSAGLIDYLAYQRPGGISPADFASILGSAAFSGGVVAVAALFRFKAQGAGSDGPARSVVALRRSRIIESAVIVIGSVMTFGLTEFFANIVFKRNPDYNPIDMLGMIPSMTIIMGTISYASLRVTGRAIVSLVSGIDRVASGDFSAELDPAHAGPYREVFENFNAMTRELRSVRTLREDFINHFSHEFKTPIASIGGFARILQEEGLSEDERKRYLGIIAAESERLAEMAGNALAMASLDSQEFLPQSEPFFLDEELRKCAILLAPQWTAKGIDLSADLDPTTVRGNADLLRRVWINLLGNAVKFTPPGGKIAVELKRRGEWAEATISDTGPGMSAEELSRAFEKYYQGAAGRAAKGLGLGLSIASRIVRLSGGEISARSESGAGCSFAVRLPL